MGEFVSVLSYPVLSCRPSGRPASQQRNPSLAQLAASRRPHAPDDVQTAYETTDAPQVASITLVLLATTGRRCRLCALGASGCIAACPSTHANGLSLLCLLCSAGLSYPTGFSGPRTE